MIVLYGWARGSGAQVINSRSKKLLWFWIVIILLQLPALVATLARGNPAQPLMMIAIFGLPVVASLSIRPGPTDLPPVQVRFNRAGCIQCDTPPDASARSKFHSMYGMLAPLIAVVFLVVAFASGQLDSAFGLMIGIVFLAALYAWMFIARRRRAVLNDESVQAIEDGARIGSWRARMTPWQRIESIDIKPVRDGCFRITIVRNNSWYAGHAVDVELDCSEDDARKLSSRMTGWRNGRDG